jgi:hypothetical protein
MKRRRSKTKADCRAIAHLLCVNQTRGKSLKDCTALLRRRCGGGGRVRDLKALRVRTYGR